MSCALTQIYLLETLTAPLSQRGRYLFNIVFLFELIVRRNIPFVDLTQTRFAPTAISPPEPGTLPSIVAINLFEPIVSSSPDLFQFIR